MGYFKPHEVQVRGRGYSIVEDVTGRLNKKYLKGFDLPFDYLVSLPTETKEGFFMTVQQTLEKKDALIYGFHMVKW